MRLLEILLFASLLFVVINASSPSFDDFPAKATAEEPSATSPGPRTYVRKDRRPEYGIFGKKGCVRGRDDKWGKRGRDVTCPRNHILNKKTGRCEKIQIKIHFPTKRVTRRLRTTAQIPIFSEDRRSPPTRSAHSCGNFRFYKKEENLRSHVSTMHHLLFASLLLIGIPDNAGATTKPQSALKCPRGYNPLFGECTEVGIENKSTEPSPFDAWKCHKGYRYDAELNRCDYVDGENKPTEFTPVDSWKCHKGYRYNAALNRCDYVGIVNKPTKPSPVAKIACAYGYVIDVRTGECADETQIDLINCPWKGYRYNAEKDRCDWVGVEPKTAGTNFPKCPRNYNYISETKRCVRNCIFKNETTSTPLVDRFKCLLGDTYNAETNRCYMLCEVADEPKPTTPAPIERAYCALGYIYDFTTGLCKRIVNDPEFLPCPEGYQREMCRSVPCGCVPKRPWTMH